MAIPYPGQISLTLLDTMTFRRRDPDGGGAGETHPRRGQTFRGAGPAALPPSEEAGRGTGRRGDGDVRHGRRRLRLASGPESPQQSAQGGPSGVPRSPHSSRKVMKEMWSLMGPKCLVVFVLVNFG